MGHIFISYSHKDKEYAHKLHQHLFEHGLDAWIDDRLDYGSRWPREIEMRIRDCYAFILIMSPNAYESEWVQNELSLARDLGKPVYPLLLDGDPWWHLRTTQYVNVKTRELPPTKFFVSLTELASKSQPKETSSVSIHINGNVDRSIINVGDKNDIQLSTLASKEAEQEKIERETAEEADHQRITQETAQKNAQEQTKREIDERVAQEQKAQEFAEKPAIINLEFTPNVVPFSHISKPKSIKAKYIIAIILVVGTVFAMLIGVVWKSWLPAAPVRNITPTATFTPKPSKTITIKPTIAISATPFLSEINKKMLLIPAGTFLMGANDSELKFFNKNAVPTHIVNLPAFYIDAYEVTNSLYKTCVTIGNCQPPKSLGSYSHISYYSNIQFDNYPVVYVDWNMAKAFCEWRGVRLPNEAEWEKAARGTDEHSYPWGDDHSYNRANYSWPSFPTDANPPKGDTTAVGSYENGKSSYGLYDMAGNVWEWVSSLYKPYPYSLTDGRENLNASGNRVSRGGGWNNDWPYITSFSRESDNPSRADHNLGFRCARNAQ